MEYMQEQRKKEDDQTGSWKKGRGANQMGVRNFERTDGS
jgi:hypothetical protein